MTPILGVIDSAKTGRLGPTYTTWISNVIRSSSNINIVAQGNAISSTGLLVSAGASTGMGNTPCWWTQDTTGTYTQKRALTGLTGWGIENATADTDGNIYIATSSGAGDNVAAKINSSGTIVWAKNVNGGNSGFVKVSPDGTRVIARSTSAEVDKWILLNGSDGSTVYSRESTTRTTQNGYIGQLSNSKIYTAGYERDSSNQGFVRQYTMSSGNQDWSVWYNDGQYSVATSCFYDSSGNVYSGGYHASDNYFVKMNSSGTLQWVKTFGGGQAFPNNGAVDSVGNVYTQVNNGTVAFLVKFNSSGTVQWQRTIYGAASTSNCGTVVVLSDNFLFVTFSASDGSGVNAYPMVVPTDGSKTGTYTVGGKTITYTSSSLSIASKGGTMSGSQGSSAAGVTTTNAGLGAVGTWTNTTGLTNI